MKKLLIYLLILFACCLNGQQSPAYTQFVFNKAGLNPAAAATDINQKLYYSFGIARTMIGFDNPPKQNFANFSMVLRPPRAYHFWQSVGCYIETDQSGVMSNNNIYAGYTYHLLLSKNIIASFGVYAGFRKFIISSQLLDPNDPLVQKTSFETFVYPDIIPGIRLSSKKFFVDISTRQITAIQQKNMFKKSGKQIGGPSYLNPNIYVSFGKVMPISNDFVLMPAVAVNNPVLAPPTVDVNVILFYNNLFGVGLAARNFNYLGAIFQIKILKNLAIGMAYNYSTNKFNKVSPSAFELMAGVVPIGLNTRFAGNRAIAKCPAVEF